MMAKNSEEDDIISGYELFDLNDVIATEENGIEMVMGSVINRIFI